MADQFLILIPTTAYPSMRYREQFTIKLILVYVCMYALGLSTNCTGCKKLNCVYKLCPSSPAMKFTVS